MDAAERQRLIQRYRAGYQVVLDALAGAGDAELDRRPAPGDWTARDVAHHLADSETTSAIRLRKLLAEDSPVIPGYDEEQFARVLYYDRPIASSLAVLEAVRECSAEILDRLTEAQWQRTGTHSDAGVYGVETWLEIYATHAHEHADQIRRARGR